MKGTASRNDQSQATDGQDRKPSLAERVQEFIENDRKKIGGMSLGAHARLGLAEIREAFNLGGNVAQATPYGMFGTLTPGEVAAERRDDSQIVQQTEEEPHMSSMNTNQPMPTPSQVIANPQAYLSPQQGQQNGNAMEAATVEAAAPDRGKDNGRGELGQLPTPSQVIANPQAYLNEQQQPGQEHEQGHGR